MPEIFMLDTDVSSYVIREHPKELMNIFIAHREDSLCISSITYAELTFGLLNNRSERLESKINQFVSLVRILDWTDKAAVKYAEIRIFLKKSAVFFHKLRKKSNFFHKITQNPFSHKIFEIFENFFIKRLPPVFNLISVDSFIS